MGKGSNVQKAQQARERNQKKLGKTEEERKASAAKAKLDASAYMCKICRQTFMVNAKASLLYLHVTAKHEGTAPDACFDSLVGFDPNDPDGEKAAAAAKAGGGAVKPKKSTKKSDDLDALLSAGLKKK
jgi:hypothetical protein